MKDKKEEAGIQVPEGTKVKSLYKAVQLLFYLTQEDRELGITELAEKSGLLKSSVYNIFSTYEECGIVKRNEHTNKYHLGVRVLELSNQFYRNNDIRQVVRPHMNEIANETGENLYLAVINGTEVIYLDGAFPDKSTGGRNMTGLKAPLYCTGIGKALLASEPAETAEKVIQGGLVRFTENTIVDGEKLREELAEIRQRGYSVDNMEHEYGIKCVAVPLRSLEGRVVAAYSITGPSLRFTKERIRSLQQILQTHAEQIQRQL